MGTSKKNRKSGKGNRAEADKTDATKSDRINLRTAAPPVRVRGQIANATGKLDQVHERMKGWYANTANDVLLDATNKLDAVISSLRTLDGVMADLIASGFSPPRKSFTAGTREGDSVSVLDEHRAQYSDILKPEKQVELTVVKKYPGRGGGLIVEAKDGTRLRVSTSHVVRLPRK